MLGEWGESIGKVGQGRVQFIFNKQGKMLGGEEAREDGGGGTGEEKRDDVVIEKENPLAIHWRRGFV